MIKNTSPVIQEQWIWGVYGAALYVSGFAASAVALVNQVAIVTGFGEVIFEDI